jgi:hypothetical protein
MTNLFFLSRGATCNLYDPDPQTFSKIEVAQTLATINRWNGHTPFAYSVAEHSLIVASFVPRRLTLAALIHDAGEAITGDICRPFRDAFPALNTICQSWQLAANTFFQLPPLSDLDASQIAAADDLATVLEARHLLNQKQWAIKTTTLPDLANYPYTPFLFDRFYGRDKYIPRIAEIWTDAVHLATTDTATPLEPYTSQLADRGAMLDSLRNTARALLGFSADLDV